MLRPGNANRVSFHCACGQRLTVRLRRSKRSVLCSNCRRTVRCPRLRMIAGRAVLRFSCTVCDKRVTADIRREGSSVRCEHCESEIAVPHVYRKRLSATPKRKAPPADRVAGRMVPLPPKQPAAPPLAALPPPPPAPKQAERLKEKTQAASQPVPMHSASSAPPPASSAKPDDTKTFSPKLAVEQVRKLGGTRPRFFTARRARKAFPVVAAVACAGAALALLGSFTDWFGLVRERVSPSSATTGTFEVRGEMRPEIEAAGILAKGQAAERARRFAEADEHYQLLVEKFASTAAGVRAAEFRHAIALDVRDEREMRDLHAGLNELRTMEEERAVLVRRRPPDRDDGRSAAEVAQLDDQISRLTSRVAERRQAVCRELTQKAERALLDGRYEECIAAATLLLDEQPIAGFAQRALTARAEAAKRGAEQVTRPAVLQVQEALAREDLVQALVIARTLRRTGVQELAASTDVRRAGEALYQKQVEDVEARLRQVPCARRASLFTSFLEKQPDLAPAMRDELDVEAKACLAREEKARTLLKQIASLAPQSFAWYEAHKTLFDTCGDTEAASAALALKPAIEAHFKTAE